MYDTNNPNTHTVDTSGIYEDMTTQDMATQGVPIQDTSNIIYTPTDTIGVDTAIDSNNVFLSDTLRNQYNDSISPIADTVTFSYPGIVSDTSYVTTPALNEDFEINQTDA